MVIVDYINNPVIKISDMSIIEEDLWIELVLSTDSLEIHHCLHPIIPVHIPIWCIVDYPFFWDVVLNILCVVFFLVK